MRPAPPWQLSLLTPLLAISLAATLPGCRRGEPLSKEAALPAPRPLPLRSNRRTPPVKNVLPNGLTVVMHRVEHAPVVALQMWVRVGSADEPEAQRGLAHVHEHMLFKGTRRRGVGEIASAVEAAGGEINAWTSYDQTVYHLVMAKRFLGAGLEILADAVLESSFDEEALQGEIAVILDEIRRTRDIPSRVLSESLFGAAYQQHPYRHPIVGTVDSVGRLTREQVLAFYRRWYVPSNMVLVLVGDLEPQATMAEVRKLFGQAPRQPAPQPKRTSEPVQREMRVTVGYDNISEAHIGLAFHVPHLEHTDVPAIDLISVLLGQGDSARLEQEARRRKGAVTDVYTYAYTPRDAGLFVIGAATPADRVERAIPALLEEVLRLRHEPIGPQDLFRARQILETEVIYQKETVEGIARKLGFYQAVAGDLGFEARYYERLAEIDEHDVREVARRYLRPDNLTVALLLPDSGGDAPVRKTRIDAERIGALVTSARTRLGQRYAPVTLPQARGGVHRLTFDNGLTLLLQEDHTVPIVSLRAVFLGGLRAEQASTQGVENLTARLLTRGTSTRSGEDLARQFDRIGGGVSGFSGRNSLGVRAEYLSSHLVEGLELVADCLLNPAFPPEEAERERSLVLEEIGARDDNLASLAFRAFSEELFGQHPYRFDPLGDLDVVARLDRRALLSHYHGHYNPARLTLSLVGDFDPQHAAQEVKRLLGAPVRAGASPRKPIPWTPPSERRVTVRFRERNQAHLVLGFAGVTLNSPDRFALDLLATVLSGQGGRLFLELRERRSMAYSIGAVSLEGVEPGYFAIYLATGPERIDEAITAVLAELERIQREGVRPEELRRAQEYLVGSQAIGLQRGSERAATLAFNDLYGLGFDAHRRYAARVMQVNPEALQQVAQRYLPLDRYVLSIVKPRATPVRLLSQLELERQQ